MVEGITVLNEVAVSGVCPTGFVILMFGILLFVLAFVLDEPPLVGVSVVVALIGLYGLLFCEDHNSTQIEALIPDSVSWNEIYDHYEVEGRRGNIWILNVLEKHDEAVKEKAASSKCSCCKE